MSSNNNQYTGANYPKEQQRLAIKKKSKFLFLFIPIVILIVVVICVFLAVNIFNSSDKSEPQETITSYDIYSYDFSSNYWQEGDIACVYKVVKDTDTEFEAKYGFIDRSGKVVIPCIYDKPAYVDFGKYIIVELDGKYGIIDIKNNEIVPCEYDDIFFNEFYGVYKGKKENDFEDIVLPIS